MQRPILVIGGGVSGCSCALRLRQHGFPVHLAEKAVFPRSKVCGCCIGGAGVSVLEQLDLSDWSLEHGVPMDRWFGSLGGQCVEVPLQAGLAISREKLDTEMLERTRCSGAIVMSPVTASIDAIDRHEVNVRLVSPDSGETFERYGLVVIASGLNASGSSRLLPWEVQPHGPFGISFTAQATRLSTGVIGMACDADGYVGLVRLEHGRVDVASALLSGSKAKGLGDSVARVRAILQRSVLPFNEITDLSDAMVTPPLRRSRVAGVGRLLAIGDASGYVEPFTGEGMTWGMMSGVEAADLIALRQDDLDEIGDLWRGQQKALLASRRRVCRIMTSFLQSSIARKFGGAALSKFPSLASPVVAHLNRAWKPSYGGK